MTLDIETEQAIRRAAEQAQEALPREIAELLRNELYHGRAFYWLYGPERWQGLIDGIGELHRVHRPDRYEVAA